MYNILVVDDEKYIRNGIVKIIEDNFNKIYNIITAKNGEEALNIYAINKVDILITDIRMPKMSGIELIQNIKAKDEKSKIIVLSGFAEFEYAQQCISFGVSNYLLKPIIPEKLVSIIKELTKAIEKEENEKNKFKDMVYANFCNIMNLNIRDSQKVNEIMQMMNFYSSSYNAYVYKDSNNGEINMNEIIHIRYVEDGYKIYITLKSINQNMIDEYAEKGYIGYVENIENICVLAEKIKELKKYKFLKNKGSFKYEEILSRENEEIDLEEITVLFNYIMKNNLEKAELEIDNLFSKEKIEKNNIEYFINVINAIENKIKEIYPEGNLEISELFLDGNIYDYIDNLKKRIKVIANDLNRIHKAEKQHVEDAKEYIAQNYKNDITMAVVANQIDINYSYFSTLFKKYFKMSFPDYINYLRIEEAKKLLTKKELKIYEISEMVGYKGNRHFMKIFKRLCGMSPTEYRIVIMNKKSEKDDEK